MTGDSQPWNVNIHYDRLLVAAVPDGATDVLEVGCGVGFLAAAVAAPGRRVVALDVDAPVLARAQERFPDADVAWTLGDVMTYELGSFDAVLSNATLHHLPDTEAALRRLASLTRPRGVLAVVGFATNRTVAERSKVPMEFVVRGVANRWHSKWEHTAPVHWPPPLSYGDLARLASDILPGCEFRRLRMGRYLLTWTRPT